MSVMTKAQLRDSIKRETRIKSNDNLDQLVDDIVADILTDTCNLARYHELLQERIPITLVSAQQVYALPADYQNLETIRYGRGPSAPCAFRELKKQVDAVKQTFNFSYPMFYRLTAAGISLFPFACILNTDVLNIDYYVDPMTLYSTDASVFPVPRILSVVKKAAIARIQRFHSSDSEAQLTTSDTAGSFNASNAAS